jgi:hypothetical protein
MTIFSRSLFLQKKAFALAGNLNVRVITSDILSDFLDGKSGQVKRV